jgi:hypothetical protein
MYTEPNSGSPFDETEVHPMMLEAANNVQAQLSAQESSTKKLTAPPWDDKGSESFSAIFPTISSAPDASC